MTEAVADAGQTAPTLSGRVLRGADGRATDVLIERVNEPLAQAVPGASSSWVERRLSEVWPSMVRPAVLDEVVRGQGPRWFVAGREQPEVSLRVTVVLLEPERVMLVVDPQHARGTASVSVGDTLLRAIFEHAAVGMALVDSVRGRFVRVDERYAAILGRTPEEMLESTWQGLTMPEDLAGDEAQFDTLVHGSQQRYSREKRYVRKDGTPVWVNLTVARTWNEGEPASFHVAAIEDISARKQAELALRESEDRYRTLIENIDGVVFSTDIEGRVTFASGRVKRYGYPVEHLLGKPLDPLIHPDDLAQLKESRRKRIAGAPPAPYDFRLLDSQGGTHHVRSTTRPLLVDGKPVGLTGVLADLTEQRTTEEQLRLAQKMEAVGRLAGGVAHDFNNLLTVIGANLEFALEQVAPQTQARADLEEVRKAAESAKALTRQLLAFSRKQILKPEAVDLNELILRMHKMLRRLIGEDVELRFTPGQGVGHTHADPGQIEQVLMNLVVNSRDAMPTGGVIRVETSTVQLTAPRQVRDGQLEPGRYVSFVVSDTGVGMDEATVARIFEPFFTTKPAGKGTGLGLATVYGIIKQSLGGIEVETARGQGTSIRVYLPADVRAADAPRATNEPTVDGGTETLLVVEDEPALRRLANRVLSRAGYRVLTADGGQEATALFAQHREAIGLLITDVIMPGIDGATLARRLRESVPALRVLYISGYSDETIAHRGVLAPDVELLEKPFTSQALLAAVRRMLDRR